MPSTNLTHNTYYRRERREGIIHEWINKSLWTLDRNGMDLSEAEDIKKRWQEYTEELYKKDLHVTHDVLCIKVK